MLQDPKLTGVAVMVKLGPFPLVGDIVAIPPQLPDSVIAPVYPASEAVTVCSVWFSSAREPVDAASVGTGVGLGDAVGLWAGIGLAGVGVATPGSTAGRAIGTDTLDVLHDAVSQADPMIMQMRTKCRHMQAAPNAPL